MPDSDRHLQPLPPYAQDVLPVDREGAVTQSVPCLECGYIVRGSHVSQACAECGTPIARSLRSLLLRFADPTWLGMIRAGMALITAFIVLNVLIPFDLIGLLFDNDPFFLVTTWFVMSFITGVFVAGQWMLTTAEPTGMLSRAENRLRISIRVLAVMAACLLLAHDALISRAGLAIEVPLIAVTSLTMVGVALATGWFLRGIADRIPDSELRTAVTVTAIGFAIGLSSYAITVLWMARLNAAISQLRTVNLFTLLGEPYGQSVVGAVLWLIAIVAAVSCVGAIVVMLGCRRAIREIIASMDRVPPPHGQATE